MRRILNTALESHQPAPLGDANISLEEEQIMLEEGQAEGQEAAQDLSEAERIIEVSDALEDLAVIADQIEEAQPTDIALVETVAQAAVAGSDVDPGELLGDAVPAEGQAMESYVGRKIATEGIRETARNIWESIQKFLKRIWEKIEGFFYKIFGTIPALRRRITALQTKVEGVAGKTVEEKQVTITTGVNSLSADGKAPKSGSEVASGLKTLGEAVSYVYGAYMDSVAKRGEKIAALVADFEPEKAAEIAGKMVDTLVKAGMPVPPGAGSANATRFPGFAAHMGKPLFGNVSLVAKLFSDKTSDSGDLGSLDRMRRAGVDLIPTSEKQSAGAKEFKMATMSVSEMEALLKNCEDLLDTLEEYKRGKRSKDVKKTEGDLSAASSKASKAFEAAKAQANGEENKDDKAAMPYYKSLVNFNTAYARWVQSPAMPLLSHSLTSIRAVMNVVEKNCAAYK